MRCDRDHEPFGKTSKLNFAVEQRSSTVHDITALRDLAMLNAWIAIVRTR
jgi:hypothetical protein